MRAADINLSRIVGTNPEQYDAIGPDGKIIGYLRLRHGAFSVSCPGCDGEVIMRASPHGDGEFLPSERDIYLSAARVAIAAWHNGDRINGKAA